MKSRRQVRAQALPLAIVLALVLVAIGLAFIFISLYFGGAQEIKQAVDSGALSVGKNVLDNINTPLSTSTADPNEQCFVDVTDNGNGQVNLRNINRVWGKALLIAINSDAATNDGNAGSGDTSAGYAFTAATNISNRLCTQLTTASNLYGFFNQFAWLNSVRMLGIGASGAVVTDPSGWQTSLMNRNDESNIVLQGNPPGFTLPPNYSLTTSQYTQCTRNPVPAAANGMYFLQGYAPLTINNRTFWQVPYQYDEKPQLVSSTLFAQAQQPPNTIPGNWTNPVPNAFSVEGQTTNSGSHPESAMSWVLTNPNQPFLMTMPHSFMHIKMDQMVADFYFMPTGLPPVEFGSTPSYGYTTDSVTGDPMPFGGIGCFLVDPGSVTVGLDVVGDSVDGVIFGSPAGDTTQLEAYMVNRINEMVSQVGTVKTASDLHSCLSDPATIGELASGQYTDFYVYSPDGVNLSCKPAPLAEAEAPWLTNMINNDPEGTATPVINDTSTAAPYYFTPTPTPIICFEDDGLDFGTEWWHKTVNWTPGTGYNGNLGLIEVTRWTDVDSLCICIYVCA